MMIVTERPEKLKFLISMQSAVHPEMRANERKGRESGPWLHDVNLF